MNPPPLFGFKSYLLFLSKLKVIEESKTIITNTIICGVCGGAGHISSDCKLKNLTSAEKPLTWQEREKMDTEVTTLTFVELKERR